MAITYAQDDVLAALRQFLLDNELPLSLLDFIKGSLVRNEPFDQIVAELRQTPEYKAAYPENDIRQSKGYDWWDEATIRRYRSQALQMGQQYGGFTLNTDQMAKLIGNNVDLSEWSSRIQKYKDFQKWGPTVKSVLEQELGRPISDTEAFSLMDPEISTPDLDRAYDLAVMRGAPAQFGLGIRPEEEATQLRKMGVSVENALQGYGSIAQNLSAVERAQAIEEHLNTQSAKFPAVADISGDIPFGTLFAATFYNDNRGTAARQRLGEYMSREIARFQAGGGASMSGTQVTGLQGRDKTNQ